jgi:hypothetical protein
MHQDLVVVAATVRASALESAEDLAWVGNTEIFLGFCDEDFALVQQLEQSFTALHTDTSCAVRVFYKPIVTHGGGDVKGENGDLKACLAARLGRFCFFCFVSPHLLCKPPKLLLPDKFSVDKCEKLLYDKDEEVS